ncbi:hypothetical protein V6Z12_A07G229600 [Gossypium hirsutum]
MEFHLVSEGTLFRIDLFFSLFNINPFEGIPGEIILACPELPRACAKACFVDVTR